MDDKNKPDFSDVQSGSSSSAQPDFSDVQSGHSATGEERTYTVKPGDSLSKIAREFYGNAGDWQKIYQANKDKIKDPNMIHPGQKIIIP